MANKILLLFIPAVLFMLIFRCFFFFSSMPPYTNGQQLRLQAGLEAEPEVSNRGQQFSVKTPENRRIYLRSSLIPRYHYGDSLAISGKLQVKEYAGGGQIYSMNYPKITVLPAAPNPLFEASKYVRTRSSRLFETTLPPIASDLLAGIVFGTKGDFPDDFFQSLRTSGVLHVIAASGMNVSFFTGAVMFSLGAFCQRRVSLFLSAFAVIFYSFLVGFEPSIIRASVMALIALSASFFGRQDFAIVSLLATGWLMLLVQPAYLFDVGFQLSFLATMGILLVKPVLGPLATIQGVGEDLTTTLSAQITTLPILLSTFGNFGLLSVLVNVLVLWTVPILMLLGSLAVLVGMLFEPLGKLLLFFSLPFLLFFQTVVSFFGALNWNLSVASFPWEACVGYYLLLGSVIIVFQKKIKAKIAIKKEKEHNDS